MENRNQNAEDGTWQQPYVSQQGMYHRRPDVYGGQAGTNYGQPDVYGGQAGTNYGQPDVYGGQQGYYAQQAVYGGQGNNYNFQAGKSRLLNPSAILGILSSILLSAGLLAPMMDFSHFEENVDIQYNLVKICKNVGLISAPWTGIPYGIVIGIIAMLVLSFVKIPLLKLIPCMLVISMFVIMLVDMGNIIDWVKLMLDKYYGENLITVNTSEVMQSLRAGVYLLLSGLAAGLVSCFVRIKEL